MTIGIDIRVLARGARTGVEEYTINLLDRLFGLDKSIQYKLFYNAYQKPFLKYPWLNLPKVELYDFKIPNRFFFVSARYFNQPKIDRLLRGIDVYFNPHFFAAPVSARCRKVMTFHDLSFEHYPHFFSWRKRVWQKFLMKTRKEAAKADKIIAVSQSTKDDLINLYGIEPEKIKVIYSGVGEEFRPLSVILSEHSERRIPSEFGRDPSVAEPALSDNEVLPQDDIRKKYNLPEKFILYFGTIEPRKNIIGLIKAFELLKINYQLPTTNYQLVIAGARGWLERDIFKAAQASKYGQDIIFTGFIQEKDKPGLYNLAELFVFPSFFEGFGFPPLEAMACGAPTIVSHTSSLPEVVGDSALMIDPYNIDELAWAMETVLTDKNLRERLKEKGIEQVKKFAWEKCAQETLGVLTEAGKICRKIIK